MLDDALRKQLEIMLDEELRILARESNLSALTELRPWMSKIKELDTRRQIELKRMAHFFDVASTRAAKRQNTGQYPPSRQPNMNANTRATFQRTSTPSASGSNPYPPRLTDEERRLLNEHEGCFKCREFYVEHRAAQCTKILSGKDYKVRTLQDALRAKAAKANKTNARATTVAAVTDAERPAPDLVAAVFPQGTVVTVNDSMSEGSETSVASVSAQPPLKGKHFIWTCRLNNATDRLSLKTKALIDGGAHMVLIRPDIVTRLALPTFPLENPEQVNVAMGAPNQIEKLTHFAIIEPTSLDGLFVSHRVHAVIAPGLCMPIILGLPFLCTNKIVCNYTERTCTATSNEPPYDLLTKTRKEKRPIEIDSSAPDILAALKERIVTLSFEEELATREAELRQRFSQIFEPPPHVDELPTEPVARIKLKNPEHTIKSRNYPCPRKWKEAWHQLLQQHLDAGRIRPSSAPAGSGAFIIPKADPTVLPRWVNDYRQLNTNTVTDSFPIPLVSEILTDIGQGKVFATLDMTNSFFQTRMHQDDVNLTAVNTPWGLYEWVVMPMGIKNAPAIHQRRVTAALRPWIGRICHVYMDDIAIWSNNVQEHSENVATILQALLDNKLYLNTKKTKLFCSEIRFLGHRISAKGVEADEGKADRVINWPTPTCAKHVRSFLGLVRYLSAFLPNLAEHTTVLDELTMKECDRKFPAWTTQHQNAFDAIKSLVTSKKCLTTIDPTLMPGHKIFVTTDASDFGSGAVLAFGPTYETARPVAYDSRAFKGAELNYPVHEKELLAIIRALAKWRTDLLGYSFEVWTDHRTLEHFGTQRDLSRRQARWMEFLSHYDATIHYLPGEKNCAADALSRLPDPSLSTIASIFATTQNRKIRSRFELEDAILDEIKQGYVTDPHTAKLISAATGMPNIVQRDGFWFVDERLVVPNGRNVRETLFRIAHDKLGHFGSPKTYEALRSAFFWPNMRRDLESAYIPACAECQRNKSRTTKPVGPLHPLPVPDKRCDSVAIDFIGPLPPDEGYNSIVTFTDRSGSDIRIIPTTTTLTAEQLAKLFFEEWYCENGLPLDIVSDRDKLFISRFWKALHKLTGIDLKLSSAYHPETDGASERTNKTVIQCIRFAVERDQKGWVRALPKVRFDIMNTINASTGFTPFQLRFGKSPRIIPPLLALEEDNDNEPTAREIIEQMQPIHLEAKDNLLEAKIKQSQQENLHRSNSFPFKIGDRAVLSTSHRRRTYKSGDEPRVAKFMPRFDGPYKILGTDEKHSTVTLDMPGHSTIFPVFHTSELKPFKENDDSLFPTRALHPPDPVTIEGSQEYFIEKIVDERRRRKGTQYLVRWRGEGPEGDIWLAASELDECEALDNWIRRKSENAARPENETPRLTITIPPLRQRQFSSIPGRGVTTSHNVIDNTTDRHTTTSYDIARPIP
jgi:hypothetical protein